ncbi:MAG: hypothetical protein U9O50_02955 [Acidobacteriota bacterium]|nr:hypothetical protein [Acidobacteriota bacterium]
MENSIDPTGKTFESILSIYSSYFKKIKEIDKREFPNPVIGKEIEATYHNLVWSLSEDKIFTVVQDRGYDINVYDFEGNLRERRLFLNSEVDFEQYLSGNCMLFFCNIERAYLFF